MMAVLTLLLITAAGFLAGVSSDVPDDNALPDDLFGSPCPQLSDPTLDFECRFNSLLTPCDDNTGVDTIATISCKPHHIPSPNAHVGSVTCLVQGVWSQTPVACVRKNASSVAATILVVAARVELDIPPANSPRASDLVNADICGQQSLPDIDVRSGVGSDDVIDYMPWVALLKYNTKNNKTKFFCTGSIINENYVLTTARCVSHLKSTDKLVGVVLGATDLTTDDPLQGGTEIAINSTIVHPNFHLHQLKNDIALLRLARPIDFSVGDEARPICLPLTDEDQSRTFVKESFFVPGWNLLDKKRNSTGLRTLSLSNVPWVTCNRQYKRSRTGITVTNTELCATDSCHGDSGGPLLQYGRDDSNENRLVLYGIRAHGPRCGTAMPIIATRVSRYTQWILENMKP